MQPPDLIPISALEHQSYCPRQCALIHQEQVFDENLFTLRGRLVHERVDRPPVAQGAGGKEERSLPLFSDRLGLIGKADMVEVQDGAPYPVEYKSGPAANHRHADLQLCAQAMCLEEMWGVSVPRGAVYHAASRKRREVVFTPELRGRVLQTLDETRRTLASPVLPEPVNDSRCRHCSLKDACMPEMAGARSRLRSLRRRLFTPEAPHA
jgi:CRISPR-associated exonuclease Cas4